MCQSHCYTGRLAQRTLGGKPRAQCTCAKTGSTCSRQLPKPFKKTVLFLCLCLENVPKLELFVKSPIINYKNRLRRFKTSRACGATTAGKKIRLRPIRRPILDPLASVGRWNLPAREEVSRLPELSWWERLCFFDNIVRAKIAVSVKLHPTEVFVNSKIIIFINNSCSFQARYYITKVL